jgi:hypothetical protein
MYIILLWKHRGNISDLGMGRKVVLFNLHPPLSMRVWYLSDRVLVIFNIIIL